MGLYSARVGVAGKILLWCLRPAECLLGAAVDSILRGLGVHNLVVIGVATNVCVEGTIRDAYQLDYRCVVPCEASASYSEEEENAGFTTLSCAFAELVSVDDVAAALTP
ncbi:MAG TPA: isochorismatase family protein, partial [Pseudonocardiaceae bacterium]|nr:isochorismatase family protein [Pseudonocardiaceae bacterium]